MKTRKRTANPIQTQAHNTKTAYNLTFASAMCISSFVIKAIGMPCTYRLGEEQRRERGENMTQTGLLVKETDKLSVKIGSTLQRKFSF